MSTDINKAVVDFVDVTGQTMKEADQFIAGMEAIGVKVAAALPGAAEAMVQRGYIRADEVKAAMAKLSSHDGALAVLQFVLTKEAEAERSEARKAAAVGNGHSVAPAVTAPATKSSSVDTTRGGFLGQKRGAGEKSAADHAFFEALGMSH